MNQSPSILCIRRMQDLGGSHEVVGLSVMPTDADSLRTAARLSTTHRKGIVPIYIYAIIASVCGGMAVSDTARSLTRRNMLAPRRAESKAAHKPQQ